MIQNPAMLVRLNNVHFGYAGNSLLSGATLQVNPQEKIGLVGPNGCGKTTLLQMMAGLLQPEKGEVIRLPGCRVALLEQEQKAPAHTSLLDSLLEPFGDVLLLRQKMERLEAELSRRPDDSGLLASYGRVQHEYEAAGGYTLKTRIDGLLRDLGFLTADLDRSLDSFSGGELGRIGLLKVLILKPDLLLLDEPTNHLDITATEKLEQWLVGFRGACVVVSHDRYFLNIVANRMVEMVGQGFQVFTGNYDSYERIRAERIESLMAQIAKQKAQIARLQEYIARNIAGQKARQARSKRNALERIDKIEIPPDPWIKAEQLQLPFRVGDAPGGKEVMSARDLTLGFSGERTLVVGLNLTVFRSERIGIVGPNGCGKTTLLRTLIGLDTPASGSVQMGQDIRIGHFDQRRTDLDPNRTLVEELRSVRGEISVDEARNLLGRLRFSGDEVFRPVRTLSGGEQNRLALGKLALKPCNLLVLDEPTNHLDIPARQALEKALEGYEGALVVVSHDRYFLDKLVKKIVMFRADGKVEIFWGNYSEARRQMADRANTEMNRSGRLIDPNAGPVEEKAAKSKNMRIEARKERKALQREKTRMERRLDDLEGSITRMEEQLSELDGELAASSEDWQCLNELTAKREELLERIGEAMAEWTELAEKLTEKDPVSS